MEFLVKWLGKIAVKIYCDYFKRLVKCECLPGQTIL